MKRSSLLFSRLIVLLLASGCVWLPALSQSLSFSEGKAYDAGVPAPDEVLGFPLGQRPAGYDEVVKYLRVLSEKSSRVKLVEMGETYESRKQYYVIVSSPENMKRLDEIRVDISRLAEPLKLKPSDQAKIAASTPAVAWAGYGIHGDELSSVDASLQVLYQLAAGTDSATLSILKELVVCIDPMENPDGRERFISQTRQWSGFIPSPDVQSMQHGIWPYGRGNHYLFDLNRDWFNLTQQENQSRIRAIVSWNPQLLIDAHEMGAYDTYLFNPPSQPLNPNISDLTRNWWKIFTADQAAAFDRHGWSYYTHEWNDDWFPGYGSSWSHYIDAVGILYEQARTDGSLVKRPDGTTLTYREAVHHHIVSSLANLTTASRHREALLEDFVRAKREMLEPAKGEVQSFYLPPGSNSSRLARLVEKLMIQNIAVFTLRSPVSVKNLRSIWGEEIAAKSFPEGTCVIPTAQPMGRLAKAILEFDPRMLSSFLRDERKGLEKDRDSRIYDVTAWSVPLAYGIETYSSIRAPEGAYDRMTAPPAPKVVSRSSRPGYGYLLDMSDDPSLEALAVLLSRGHKLRCAREPFSIEGREYPRGTVLIRLHENAPSIHDDIDSVSNLLGASFTGVSTALSKTGRDLGGTYYELLKEPRVAVLAGPSVGTTSAGSIWHLLDRRLHMRMSLIHADEFAFADLEKYNIIILPSGGYQQSMGKSGAGKLREWVMGGGTLIGIEGGAAYLADSATGLSETRLRHQALKDLDLYSKAVELERKAGSPKIDSVYVWDGKEILKDTSSASKVSTPGEKELAMADERGRLFMPRGAILRLDLDPEHWLNFGSPDRLPALLFTSNVFLAKTPVRTPARFAKYADLRLSGLLWPEARERWASTAFATCEGKGKGQIILFAGDPVFRASFPGTERLFLNAILLGPGFGTEHKVEW